MAKKISGSVGKGGKNVPEDVRVVKELLNPVARDCGFAKLKPDEKADAALEKAITAFQTKALAVKANGLVRSGSKEMEVHNKGPKAVRLGVIEWQRMIELEHAAKRIGIKKEILSKYCAQGVTDIRLIPCDVPKVTGKKTGIDKKLMFVLEAVSAHFGEALEITSGLRTAQEQADTMWNNWNGTIQKGKAYPFLEKREELRLELDGYKTEDKKKPFVDKVKPIAKYLSLHMVGKAIDLNTNTSARVKSALDGMLHRVKEPGGVHYDLKNINVPSKIPDKTRESWAR